MDTLVNGQACVVIGGGSGIGLAIADAFDAEGCKVGVIDCHQGALDALGKEREGFETYQGDIASIDSMEASRSHFMEVFGRIDHVVVAAANSSGKFGFPYWNLDPGDWSRVIDVSLMGPVNIAHAYGPGLAAAGEGTLLFITSVAGQMGSQTDPPYSAAKAAVINFMQCAAKDLAPYKVRVNALAPGMVKTPLNESVWAASQARLDEAERQDYETWAQEKIAKVAPLGEWQTPSEFGAMAVFLASPHGANITGQVLNIDGGQVMRG